MADELRVWTFRGPGEALTALVVVVAVHEPTAVALMREWCAKHAHDFGGEKCGVDPDKMRIERVDPLAGECVVYGWNGDY